MTESSAKASSDFECQRGDALTLQPFVVHIWLSHRQCFANSDLFKRTVLSRYAPVQPSDWRFESGVHGKPALVDPPVPLTFNVSHSRERLACAVALDLPLGVDLEYRHPDRELMRVARRYFQREEVKVLESLPEQSKRDHFYDLWTLKESAVKARGEALPTGLGSRGFAILQTAGVDRIHTAGAIQADERFWLFDLDSEYRLSLCALSQEISAVDFFHYTTQAVPLQLVPRAASADTQDS